MTNYLWRRIEREIQRKHEQELADWLFGQPRGPTYRVPKDAPCNNCIQRVGSSVCRNVCTYWPKLRRLAKEGKLEVVRDD